MEYALMALTALLGAAVAWIVYDVRSRRRAAQEEAHDGARDWEIARATAEMMREEVALCVGASVLALAECQRRAEDYLRSEAAGHEVRARVAERKLDEVSAPLVALGTLAANLRDAAVRQRELLGALESIAVLRRPILHAERAARAPCHRAALSPATGRRRAHDVRRRDHDVRGSPPRHAPSPAGLAGRWPPAAPPPPARPRERRSAEGRRLVSRPPTIELARSEIANVADVLDILRAPHGEMRRAAEAHDIPATAFTRILLRHASYTAQENTLDAIARAVGVTRAELLAGRALAAARRAAAGAVEAAEGTPS